MKHKKFALVALFGLLALASCGNDGSSGESKGDDFKATDWVGDFHEVAPTEDLATGVKNFAVASAQDRAELLQLLETYTIDNFLGGIPYRDNSGYVLYNARLDIPSETYVPGYGYGVLEGEINAPLTHADITPAHSMYYHSRMSKDPGTANYLDGQDSVTGDVHGIVNASYWSTRFTENKDGYEWYPLLATEDRPVPLNEDAHGMATEWRVKLRVGGDLKYNTLSEKAGLAAYKGRAVALEDYLTPFRLMIENEWFRSTDLSTRASGFKNVGDYIGADLTVWPEDIGIQLNVDEQALDFTFNTPKTRFYAMYNLSSSLFSPIPADFITAIGGADEYGKPNIDSMLSLNNFMFERWEASKEIVFKKNPLWIEADERFIDGFKYVVEADTSKAFEDFIAGKLDGIGVPSTRLQEFKNDPRARQTLGDTVWKLQVNAADPGRWNELFGPEGSIAAGSEWDLKPVMSNRNFLNGLYYSIDRAALAEAEGSRPAQAFLSDAYMIDPEGGLSFRDTPEGKAVIADRAPETLGYSKALAKQFFKDAMTELVAQGAYAAPKAGSPETIELKLIFQDQEQVETEGKTLEGYFESAFDEAETGFKLDVQSYATSDWMDAYYAAMFGEFDLAFGSIGGNTLDPINFMDTVRSDNSTGFTLSWGIDTSVVSESIKYKGEYYSFDSLQEASQGLTILEDGYVVPTFSVDIGASLATWDVVATSAGKKMKNVMLTGTYFDGDPDLVVDVLGADVVFYDEDGAYIGHTSADEDDVMQKDGAYVILVGDVVIPEGAYYMDVYVNYMQTYQGGFPEDSSVLYEFYAPEEA